MFKQHCIRC